MTELTPSEQLFMRTMEEIADCPTMEIASHTRGDLLRNGGNVREVSERIAEHGHPAPPEDMRNCFMRFRNIGAYWYSTDPDSPVGGEFNLIHLSECIRLGPPLWHSRSAWSPEQRALFSQFRVFDSHYESGAGTLGCLRMMPDGEPPEIWFYDNSRGACKLNITYCAYLDNVRITKGAHGWQYLFSDISLTEPGNTHLAGSLAETLDFLETALPDHDYTPLRTRLSSKTGKKPPAQT
jgi:hypothetical protein